MAGSSHLPGRILLLVGGSEEAGHALLGAITHPSAPPPLSSGRSTHQWRLDTKYYTAEVLFELRHVDQSPRLENGADEAAAYEAVLLVFEADLPESFASLQRWWEAAGGGDAELGVRLAVAVAGAGAGSSGSSAGSPAWLAEAEQWCAEQLVELVHVPAQPAEEEGAPGPGAGVPNTAGSDRSSGESSGVERIREALQAHMWPGMQLKRSPQRGMAAAEPPAQQADRDAAPTAAGSVRLANVTGSSVSGASEAAAAVAAQAAAAEAGDLSFEDFLRSPAEAAAAVARGQHSRGSAAEQAAGAVTDVDAGAEAEVEELQRLFALVAGHRAELAQLPDAQRREAAAGIVMQLLEAMGLSDEGEEGSDEETG
ncbi:hypothetical protein ABPG77_010714 [Micractinium sp. CCAP 211/92]